MELKNLNVGVAMTGSFCTFAKAFFVIEELVLNECNVTTIFSLSAARINCRFGKSEDFLKRAEAMTGKKPILTIEDAEQIGPKKMFDILVILPCTGNTLAKLATGITDTPSLMAAKAHLRNERPLLISLSTNDALSNNLKNIGHLMNTKNIFFVPFGQDNHKDKPSSMTAHTQFLIPAMMKALDYKQYQPVLISPQRKG